MSFTRSTDGGRTLSGALGVTTVWSGHHSGDLLQVVARQRFSTDSSGWVILVTSVLLALLSALPLHSVSSILQISTSKLNFDKCSILPRFHTSVYQCQAVQTEAHDPQPYPSLACRTGYVTLLLEKTVSLFICMFLFPVL